MSSEKRPVCPSCSKPLHGELAASGCNAVFHRSCLAELVEKRTDCPECGVQHSTESTLDLFGVSFGGAVDPGAAALAARIASQGGLEGLEGDRAESFRSAAALLERRDEADAIARRSEAKRAAADEARALNAKQREKLRAVTKALAKKEAEVAKLKRELQVEAERKESLLRKVDIGRQLGTVSEYWDKIKTGQEAAALKFLSTMVSLAGSPARILAEVSRLRRHIRDTLDRERRDAAAASQRLSEGRRQLAKLDTEQRKRRGGMADSTQQSAAKRQRAA